MTDVDTVVDNAVVTVEDDEKTVALKNARAALATLRELAEESRGGRPVDGSIHNVADTLDAYLNEVEATVTPTNETEKRVAEFLDSLQTEIDRLTTDSKAGHNGE